MSGEFNNELCVSCLYYRCDGFNFSTYYCHYMILTGHSRGRESPRNCKVYVYTPKVKKMAADRKIKRVEVSDWTAIDADISAGMSVKKLSEKHNVKYHILREHMSGSKPKLRKSAPVIAPVFAVGDTLFSWNGEGEIGEFIVKQVYRHRGGTTLDKVCYLVEPKGGGGMFDWVSEREAFRGSEEASAAMGELRGGLVADGKD